MPKELVKFIDKMGTDKAVCDAARVSMHKYYPEFREKEDTALLKHLARNKHWSPFSQVVVKLWLEMDYATYFQWSKSIVALSISDPLAHNQESRRYVDNPPEMFSPKYWRSRPEKNIKQGSGEDFDSDKNTTIKMIYDGAVDDSNSTYKLLLDLGVAPEMARFILPVSTYTEFVETGSLAAWARICKLRLDPHSQKEIRDYANAVDKIMQEHFPVSWKCLMEADVVSLHLDELNILKSLLYKIDADHEADEYSAKEIKAVLKKLGL